MTDHATPSTAVWYFVGATFLLVGCVFMITVGDGLTVLALIAAGLGLIIGAAGAVVAAREARARRARSTR